ncbi:hypothetical protein [Streptomyces roseochromogenus]|uniref:Uncharacterized protein n=1 Tax=Streptomyces roseochromogenus subsp. oscitans DS 12.976 TaxID=1352936 RepID=V6KS76_STRRC|nr:hypothetical protein [Streptomyces roseochromogenus]EST34873.1 hypothetical protein M878_08395 [Streptomyces roseochromogenus subsp. oscitans DS 12.976]
MAGTLEQNFKSVLRRNKVGGVGRIARTADFTTKIRQAVVSQSRYHIEG